MDTIYALSSGNTPSGVAVIRVSGGGSRDIVELHAGDLPAPRSAILRLIRDRNGNPIDRGIVLWFPGPGSFTGEDCAEFHLHGGRAVVDRMLEELGAHPDSRMAEAGEFSRRAFVNGKFDLTEAEGLADLIASETEAQRVLALAQASGALHDLYKGWRARLLHGQAMIAAEIDFADEEDVPGSVSAEIWDDMASLAEEMHIHLGEARRGSAIREGFRIAIVGPPNAGKSSLLNALAGSDVTIVSDEPGTTRDAIEVRLSIAGHLVLVIDTAGIREGAEKIEAEGIRRAFVRAADADLVLHLSETGSWSVLGGVDEDRIWRVRSKRDVSGSCNVGHEVAVSTKTSDGLQGLLAMLEEHLAAVLSVDAITLPTRQRHFDNVKRSLEDLKTALENDADALEIRAEALRVSADYLGRIIGHSGVEDILGIIFSEFCVGK
ncbi:tRNA uridine-5-carboxymethylaminomethyl(34) synthesis GTPase MnmE [Oricola cellulosilytica]|nr:tRNA uridine-5-carboxymethylaminomethyl(34) synthesis GTPase MnmE [Oricola cellulosilytica]